MITAQWVRVFHGIDRLNREHNWQGKETGYDDLLREYRELLYRLNEHHDACLSVLRSLCPPGKAKPTTFDSTFLKAEKLPGAKSFLESTLEYREKHLGFLVNTLMHRQGELCAIFFYSPMEFRPGYFLRDVMPDGALGPSFKLHPGGRTAFSFARDMMIHLWWLYRIGDLLSRSIDAALDGLYGLKISPETKLMDNPDLLSVIKKLRRTQTPLLSGRGKEAIPKNSTDPGCKEDNSGVSHAGTRLFSERYEGIHRRQS